MSLSFTSPFQHRIDDGQIVLISSMSGHRVPLNPSGRFYAATKFAVRGLLEGWRQEVIVEAIYRKGALYPVN